MLPITSQMRSADAAAAGRQQALDVALAASRSRLCDNLAEQLQACVQQWQAAYKAASRGQGAVPDATEVGRLIATKVSHMLHAGSMHAK